MYCQVCGCLAGMMLQLVVQQLLLLHQQSCICSNNRSRGRQLVTLVERHVTSASLIGGMLPKPDHVASPFADIAAPGDDYNYGSASTLDVLCLQVCRLCMVQTPCPCLACAHPPCTAAFMSQIVDVHIVQTQVCTCFMSRAASSRHCSHLIMAPPLCVCTSCCCIATSTCDIRCG